MTRASLPSIAENVSASKLPIYNSFSSVFADFFQNHKPNWTASGDPEYHEAGTSSGADGSPMISSILSRFSLEAFRKWEIDFPPLRWEPPPSSNFFRFQCDFEFFMFPRFSDWKLGTIENGINKREGEREIVEHDMKFNERIGFCVNFLNDSRRSSE